VVAESAGYPLRDEATESFAPPPLEPVEEEIYAAPAEPGVRVARRRRVVSASPWPAVLAVLLLLAGLGVAYAVTRPSSSTGRSVARSTSDPADDGKMVGEQPHAGSRASRGSTVTVYVARSSGG
jgi:hypothetical protein